MGLWKTLKSFERLWKVNRNCYETFMKNCHIFLKIFIMDWKIILENAEDSDFDVWAYFYGILSLICQVLFLTLVEQMHSSSQKYSAFDMLYLNSINSIFLFLILDIFDDEIYDAIYTISASHEWYFIILFLFLVIGFGVALTFYQFICITVTSALSTSVASNCKSTIAAFVGYVISFEYLLDGELGAFNLFGMLINWGGGLLFLNNKWIEKYSLVKTSWW